ncbi:helix-turn-helix transcriptional regulator [Streptomyces ficellus]|uniref:Helix-turn-helix transcriptional regulator n=1 Tax=Streptomyces ficellus TaxID=1977088 RepID=A0ABT7ZEP8_9ACTN|nr:helix-turn-helix transcriptional regulator [Streptomyces ficellus]MDN3297732.1 helix-turn-helix transcriptional regulator [Streptomyces ficellus]
MSGLGITAAQEAVYRHFLRNPHTSEDEIHTLLGLPRQEVGESVLRLCALGVLNRTGPDALAAADPETAVDRLTDLRLRELHEELARVTQSRHLVAELRQEQARDGVAAPCVERLADVELIRARIDDLAFFAREEILSVEPYGELTPENIAHARPLDQRCLRRGVRIRSVLPRTALDHPPTAGYLRELASQGALIRVAPSVTERILVYDRSTALVPADPDDTTRGALLAREDGLVANVLALFEKIWSEAEPLPPQDDDGGATDHPTELEQRVLASMCRVSKDEIGARELGISVRTYRRHIADLMQLLGAAGRPQAALLARERGWI